MSRGPELAALLATPTVSRPVGYDTDRDGMPDAWEATMGLNPASAADGKLDHDSDGYTNVEEYLNEAGAFSGYASRFGEVDLGKDRVERGAFLRSLARRGARLLSLASNRRGGSICDIP